jgi:gluconokinase
MNWVVMGVSGCGKTTVGRAFARAVGARFVDGDDLHPAGNVAKMSAGVPLTDADRWPWLDRVGQELTGGVVIGCSALKRAYRDRIRAVAGPVRFLHLAGSREVIAARMAARTHFMPLGLLDSQFVALEPLGADENGVTVDIDQPFAAVVAALVAG